MAIATQPFTIESQFCRKDGDLRCLSTYVNSFWNGDTHAYNVITVVVDITDRESAEAALQQSEARFQQLAASPALIYNGEEYPGKPVRFEYLSPAFEEIHGIPLAL